MPRGCRRSRTARAATRGAVVAAMVTAGVTTVGGGLGCRPKARKNPPLCEFKSSNDEEVASQSLTPPEWLAIISPGVDRSQLVRKGPLKDTCGRVVNPEAQRWSVCADQSPPTVPRSGDAIEASDMVIGQIGKGRLVAWAATEELATGEAMGPAALVFWKDKSLEVHAAGVVRGRRDEARMRLHHTSGAPVLILESQRCESGDRCVTEAKFVPIVSRRFTDVPLLSPEGECLGEATVPLSRRLEQASAGKMTRRFELQRTIELAEDGIYLVDLVVGNEFNPRDPAGSVEPFRRVTARRKLEFAGDHFVVRDRDLWANVLSDYGLVGAHGAPPPVDDEDDERGAGE